MDTHNLQTNDDDTDMDNILTRVTDAMASDIGENLDKQSGLLLDLYDDADDAGRKLIDDVFICLCGWSLATLRANDHTKDE